MTVREGYIGNGITIEIRVWKLGKLTEIEILRFIDALA
jgi:hypothetical protein